MSSGLLRAVRVRRTVVTVLVVGLLVIGTGPTTMAQTPPAEPTPEASGFEAADRFVLPEGGYAVTFPRDWVVEVHRYEDGSIPYVDARETGEEPADGPSYCWVRAYPCGDGDSGSCAALIDEAAAREVASFESGTGFPVPTTVESMVLALPAGYTVLVDVINADPRWERSYYRMTDGKSAANLGCSSTQGPVDRWLSIAQSFEFLATAE